MDLRIVIVDDAPFIRELVCQFCEKTGIKVVGEACDGEEAIEVVKALKPDVVFMDLIMPKKSGIDASTEIMAALPDTKIIACSTADDSGIIMRALDAGCVNFVTKPFEGNRLIEIIYSSVKPKSTAGANL